MKNNYFILAFVTLLGWNASAQICFDWFQNLNIKSKDINCLSICNTAKTDMATFSCHNECQKFCKQKKNLCNLDKSKLRFEKMPTGWPWPDQKPLKLTKHETSLVESALATINPDLIRHIDGIYFFEKPKDLFSISTETSYYGNQIIIYKNALNSSTTLNEKIVHELGHSLHEGIEKKTFSEYTKKYFNKSRKYLTADSKFNAEEDFATNLEIYITKPLLLKKELTDIFNWFDLKFSKKYNSRKCDL